MSARPPRQCPPADTALRSPDLAGHASDREETWGVERGDFLLDQFNPADVHRCTGADLLALLSRLPRPDDEFLAAVEEVTLNQPSVQRSASGA